MQDFVDDIPLHAILLCTYTGLPFEYYILQESKERICIQSFCQMSGNAKHVKSLKSLCVFIIAFVFTEPISM